jgi:ferredoxin
VIILAHAEKKEYQKVVIDQDICISCGACVAVCPVQAIELDENAKARLIWDVCIDDFACVKVCPVNCIWPTSQAPPEPKAKSKWYRFNAPLEGELKSAYETWKQKYNVTGEPA